MGAAGQTADRLQEDRRWMRAALRLARRAWGRTSPNPMVGALVVRDGQAVGKGRHRAAGEPHAERVALQDAGDAAAGATLYVTLEPCCTFGRTPPCTDAIIAAGVRRVVVGTLDPNPLHAGKGLHLLAEHGIEVTSGVEEAACRELNEAFFTWITEKRPFVLLKMAMTLDGKIAAPDGSSKWITGEAARRHVQRLRQWADAILVGGETVRKDNPSLTVRRPRNWPRQPLKLVWSRRRDFPKTLNIWADPDRPPRFIQAADREEWLRVLHDLGAEEITALLVEGGAELAGSMLRADVVDRVAFFIAPRLLGGRDSRPVTAGPNPLSLADSLPVEDVRVQRIGEDLLYTGRIRHVHGTD